MESQIKTIHIESGSDLARALEQILDRDCIVEKEGIRYRITRLDADHGDELAHEREAIADSRGVLEIIGLGDSNEETDIAANKDKYIADASDHRLR
jgi:hypothetical protein